LAVAVAEETDPPRKLYGFKEREFKRDNAPVSEAGGAPTAQDLAKMAGPVTRSGPVGGGAKAGDPNDVYAVLERNRAVEKKSGGDDIEVRKIRSRRTRDYWLMLLGGNIALVGGGLFFGGAAIVFALAGVIIYSLGLTWVVWQLMGRY
jgi:hypothetical protein